MNRLKQIARNAKNLQAKKILFTIYNDAYIQDVIIDLNRINQIFKDGVTADNKGLDTYSPFTEEINRGRNFGFGGDSGTKRKLAGEPVLLLDEGDFYKSFKVKAFKNGSFKIIADTLKEDNDLLEYGEILGLTKESINELIKEILPIFIEETRKALLK